jgi:tryptophan-rich sensory protein
MKTSATESYLLLGAFSALSLMLLIIGGVLTYAGLGAWYYELDFPPFQPPPGLFTPAWIVVLSCLALSTWLIAVHVDDYAGYVAIALSLYGAQVVLNVGWSLLFFTVQRPDIAFWELIVLDTVLVAMVLVYSRVSRWAALLLTPYIVWLILSTLINGWIVTHNTVPMLSV